MLELLWVYLGIGALFIALGLPLWWRRVPPNGWYGFRVSATLNNPDVWYPVNEVSGRWMALVGAVHNIVVSVAWLIPGMTEDALVITGTVSVLAATAVMTVAGFVELRRQTRKK